MVAKDSLYSMRLGGADFDGDMVKYIADYTISNNAFEQKYQAFEKYPLLYIPTEEPIIADAKDYLISDKFIQLAIFMCLKKIYPGLKKIKELFQKVLDKFCRGMEDDKTVEILGV